MIDESQIKVFAYQGIYFFIEFTLSASQVLQSKTIKEKVNSKQDQLT